MKRNIPVDERARPFVAPGLSATKPFPDTVLSGLCLCIQYTCFVSLSCTSFFVYLMFLDERVLGGIANVLELIDCCSGLMTDIY